MDVWMNATFFCWYYEQLAIMQALVNQSSTDRRNLSIMTSDALLSLFVTIINFKVFAFIKKKFAFFV